MTREHPKPIMTRDVAQTDQMATRLTKAAERILTDVMHRQRWTANDRDALAAALKSVVVTEMRYARMPLRNLKDG